MSKPVMVHDVVLGDVMAAAEVADHSRPMETESPKRPQVMSEAGVTNVSPQPTPIGLDSAIALLARTVQDLEARGRNASAAGVSARMLQTEPGFRVSALGLPNFRAFLGAAQLQGIVHVHKPAGATDVVISSGPPDSAGFGGGAPDRGEDQPPVSRPPLASAVASKGRWLRADLWRALTDFSDTRYAYSPRTRTTFAIDPDPGTAAALGGGDSLDLPAMTGEEQKRWVSAFVTTCAPVGQRERLHELAETAEGVRAFTDEALTTPEVRRRWGRFLREHTTARAQTWAEEQSIPFSDLLDPVRPDPRPVAVATPEPAAPEVAPRTAEEELRSEILAVLSRLSLEELLVLRIPAKYALLR